MKNQKEIDKEAIRKKMAVSHNTKGGKHAMSKMNPQMPDKMQHRMRPLFPNLQDYHKDVEEAD